MAAGEQRIATAMLLTDMVGSTELRTRLGEEAADELLDDADATIGGLTLPALQQQSGDLRARLEP